MRAAVGTEEGEHVVRLGVTDGDDPGHPDAARDRDRLARIARVLAVQRDLWALASATSLAAPTSLPVNLFTQSVNEVVGLHTERVAAARNHVPSEVVIVLYGLAMIAMGLIAYDATLRGRHNQHALFVTAILTAAVLALIVDMDQPWLGFLTTDQRPLTELLQDMGASPN